MQLYEDLNLTVYEDEGYTISVDTDEQIVNIFLEDIGLTLELTYEDFQTFRDALNSIETLP
jgi:hypothetical protein